MKIINGLDTNIDRALGAAIKNCDGLFQCYHKWDGKDELGCICKGAEDSRDKWYTRIAELVAEYYKCEFIIADDVMTFLPGGKKSARVNSQTDGRKKKSGRRDEEV